MEKHTPSASNASLEQFILLAKGAKGAAAAELVKTVTEAPGIYVFGELLDMPNIKEVSYLNQRRLLELAVLFDLRVY